LSFIIGFFVRRWVDKPVKELLKATDQVSIGNLNYTIIDRRSDEMGMLSRSFNNMTMKLSEARMQLFNPIKWLHLEGLPPVLLMK